MENRAALIALVAGAIRYGHIGTNKEIVADAAEFVKLAEEAAGDTDEPKNPVLAAIGATHLEDSLNSKATGAEVDRLVLEAELRGEQRGRELAAQVPAIPGTGE